MLLEKIALSFCNRVDYDISEHYWQDSMVRSNSVIHTKDLFVQIIHDLKTGYDIGCIAVKFHLTLVQIIKVIAQQNRVKKIAFSGGVFQNTLLLDLITQHLSADFELYFHQQLSPNDENISFGQWAYALATDQF
jgi:hydrogenase maturation protein HypF